MYANIITFLQTFNQLLSAGIAITAFSLLLYVLSFNLRDRVTRSFAIILISLVIIYVADAIGSTASDASALDFWLRIQWVGIVFLPAAYLHFSDALLATTGQPSRGRRRLAVRLAYLVSVIFLVTLPFAWLVGPVEVNGEPAPHLQRTALTWFFTVYYAGMILWAWVNIVRAYQRTSTSAGRRRMGYLMVGSLAPALGSYPYLLFGSDIAADHQIIFWGTTTLSNILVSVLLVLMAYAVAFFGVPWPDRVVKRRLFKWIMRGPVTASSVLAITTIARRFGQSYDLPYNTYVPIIMVATLLIFEYTITLAAPIWERWLFHGADRKEIELLQKLEERQLTSGDLKQFLEAVLAAVCDRLQSQTAFVASIGLQGVDLVVTVGDRQHLEKEDLSTEVLAQISQKEVEDGLFSWGAYWLVPLFSQAEDDRELLGLLGVAHQDRTEIDSEQAEALALLTHRAAQALEDRKSQQTVFSSLEALTPDVELIQSLRAATRYEDRSSIADTLAGQPIAMEEYNISSVVKDALTHYWGGPKLTESPLIKLQVVQQAMDEHGGNTTNALRATLREAIERVRPEGERRFTGEWILYNILELKFMQGRKVRQVALRLAVSEADLYRKQRVAIEAVANAIIEMEREAISENQKTVEMNPAKVMNS